MIVSVLKHGVVTPTCGKDEYVTNCLTKFVWLPYKTWIKYRFYKEFVRLGFSIPLNCFGPGFSIAHYETITIGNAKVGRNCRFQEGVNIGSTGGDCCNYRR